ncbi:cupin domain-containing protein [Micromonospora sp. WMMD1120]|uniref:cupin domain-containing protein n=1 Tax=Micromonospora sp. WMMD1120 TaxID=3016106 RepID=UPI0024170C61|nr:cupin domain-containing protein [Micromonospora sp. WMMD1120]MDG4810777.1 cupin domain-containing protein [Micromonospora sp. WMMD1120]
MIVADTSAPAEVHGVHGADGTSWWKCFVRGAELAGAWEAVEWARLPPGGLSGEHLHTRTEEVYILLAGTGEIILDGRPTAVRAGDVVLTGIGTRHGLLNTGPDRLSWLVVELLGPDTAAVFGRGPAGRVPAAPSGRNATMPAAQVLHLQEPGEIDPTGVLTGPLKRIARQRLAAHQQDTVRAAGREFTLFVVAGSGAITSGQASAALGPEVSVTLPLGSAATLTAGADGLDLFVLELLVPDGAPA